MVGKYKGKQVYWISIWAISCGLAISLFLQECYLDNSNEKIVNKIVKRSPLHKQPKRQTKEEMCCFNFLLDCTVHMQGRIWAPVCLCVSLGSCFLVWLTLRRVRSTMKRLPYFVFNICCATMSGAASSIGYSGNLVVVILVYCCNYGNIYLL